jgi:hypothetical protein
MMLFFIPLFFWLITAVIVLDFLGAQRVRKQAQQFAGKLYAAGPCTRIRVKGYLVENKGRKIPVEGKIYINYKTGNYIFYADLTYQLLYAEKWLFTHEQRNLYKFSTFRQTLPGPFQPDFLPQLFLSKGSNGGEKHFNAWEEGEVKHWRELEDETIPRWISHSLHSLGVANLEITFFANESNFLWW